MIYKNVMWLYRLTGKTVHMIWLRKICWRSTLATFNLMQILYLYTYSHIEHTFIWKVGSASWILISKPQPAVNDVGTLVFHCVSCAGAARRHYWPSCIYNVRRAVKSQRSFNTPSTLWLARGILCTTQSTHTRIYYTCV